jgi:hypothetical protein
MAENGISKVNVPTPLEQLAGLRACIDSMTRSSDRHAALQQNQIEELHGALELSRRSLDAVHAEWRAVVGLLCEAMERLRESGDIAAADELRALLRRSLDRMESGMRPTLN